MLFEVLYAVENVLGWREDLLRRLAANLDGGVNCRARGICGRVPDAIDAPFGE